MSKILIIRFSALGDVAMTIPVIRSLAIAYPMHEITVLSAQNLKPLFAFVPEVRFIGADLKSRHSGITGLNKLFEELRAEHFDYVADFHSVIRSGYLRTRFALSGAKTAVINKGRIGKKRLTRKRNKHLLALKSNFERYHDVLTSLGFQFELQFSPLVAPEVALQNNPAFGPKGQEKWIGVAPFAKHKGKIYPLELMESVLAYLGSKPNYKVFVFGGGTAEKEIVEAWSVKYPTIISLVGRLSRDQELQLMSRLDLMLSMDSANMHLASLVGTQVVSVWGATHPYAGFMGWNQSPDNAIQVELACRPCSVYGQKKCHRGDYACLTQISPDTIIKHIDSILL